ncbi:MAG TPA: formate dehydrogenase [Rhodospirillaceae bacterium]|nr:formate dehydrogenase [Rhodospirillaceae bacterium]MBB57218.1 formate dehydrogenase [Rhodospirillaceae bacterium]HAE00090.1 formate dehydrogenase [Rhodospirillaceae bacterium]HAJ18919.1 formate dehydrogenase [Rhodospirillaceae bacterium]HBM14435.1 formate dehydrogenase [Rhodospirillaceae bacterium]|tara:strand:+ start:791 stop:1000 length:210 start_codon:yes stop_codon:yes gene_type:complete
MSDQEQQNRESAVSRRQFFGAATKGVAVGAGAMVAAVGVSSAQAEEPSTTTGDYRETAHVKTYYELARF